MLVQGISLLVILSVVYAIYLLCKYRIFNKNNQKPTVKSIITTYLFVLYIGAVLAITLLPIYPNIGLEARPPVVNLVPFKSIYDFFANTHSIDGNYFNVVLLKNIAGNIGLFVPFGFFVALFIFNKTSKPKFITALLCIVGFSFLIEVTQFLEILTGFSMMRIADIDDVILNTIGGIIGYFIFVFIKNRTKRYAGMSYILNEKKHRGK